MLQSEEFKSQLFISTTAWVFIIVSSVVLYFFVTNFAIFRLTIETQQAFLNTLTDDENTREVVSNMRMMAKKANLFLIIGMLSTLAMLLSSILLLKRKNTGRILLTIISLINVGLIITFAYYLKYQAGEMQNLLQLNPDAEAGFFQMQLAAQVQLISYLVFLIIIAWVLVRALIKLNSRKIRVWFE